MKLRLRHNSIRLRLTQSEVEQFAAEGRIEEQIRMGPGDDDSFVFELKSGPVGRLGADLDGNRITVSVPAELAGEWTETDRVGMEEEVQLADGLSLHILVEKDFRCLTPRRREDEPDAYPHPGPQV